MPTDNQTGTAIVVMQRSDMDLKLIRSTLKKIGFTVVTSEDGKDLPKLLTASGDSLHLVVADPSTPGLNFSDLLKKLHDTDSPARVLCVCEDTAQDVLHKDALHTSEYAEHIGGRLKRPFRRSHLLASILDATEQPLARTA
jgi:response regulator RpfG family c-di-GMP phosphodiesterase